MASGAGLPTRGFFCDLAFCFSRGKHIASHQTEKGNTYLGWCRIKIYGAEFTGEHQDTHWLIFKHIVKVFTPTLSKYCFTNSSFLPLIEIKYVVFTLKIAFYYCVIHVQPSTVSLQSNLFLSGTKVKHRVFHVVK